jgi:starch phosphorylase
MMKDSLHNLCPMFNTHRMVTEYWTRFYIPSAERRSRLIENDWKNLKNLSKWREKIMLNWSNVVIKEIRMDNNTEIDMGASFKAEADIYLGELSPDDLLVEAYYGRLDPSNQFLDSFTKIMEPAENVGDNIHRFHCDINFEEVGHFGINIRLTPNHPNPESRHAMGLVIWGEA